MENKVSHYITKDLHFAAFLKLSGITISKLEKSNKQNGEKNPVFFYFIEEDKCKYLEAMYWNGEGEELMVNIKDYIDEIKDLRARIASVSISQSMSGF